MAVSLFSLTKSQTGACFTRATSIYMPNAKPSWMNDFPTLHKSFPTAKAFPSAWHYLLCHSLLQSSSDANSPPGQTAPPPWCALVPDASAGQAESVIAWTVYVLLIFVQEMCLGHLKMKDPAALLCCIHSKNEIQKLNHHTDKTKSYTIKISFSSENGHLKVTISYRAIQNR